MKLSSTILIAIIAIAFTSGAFGQENPFKVKITSLSNTRNNEAIEVCGTATHQDEIWPLVVTVVHDQSSYSTLTAPDSKWCTLIKRWTFSGKVEAQATTLSGEHKSLNKVFFLKSE